MSGSKCRPAHIDLCPPNSDVIKYAPARSYVVKRRRCQESLLSCTAFRLFGHEYEQKGDHENKQRRLIHSLPNNRGSFEKKIKKNLLMERKDKVH